MGSSSSDGPNTFIYYYRSRSYNGDSLYLLLVTLLLGINPFRGVTGYFHLCISSGIKRDFPTVSSGHLAAPVVSIIGGFIYSIAYIDVGVAPGLVTLSIRGSRDLTIYDAFTPLYSSELNSLTIFVVLYLLLRLLVVVFNT